jgi:hypothetical protein
MRAKTAKGGTTAPDGANAEDSAANAQQGAAEMGMGSMMPNDGGAGAAAEDRGMPGLGRRDPTGAMPAGGMEPSREGREFAMPGGGMGNGSSARPDFGVGGGGSGFGGGGAGGKGGGTGSDGGGEDLPRVRKCATMDVHRRLLSSNPEYARMRDEIENQARRFELSGASALRSGITRIPVVVHVVWNTSAQNISDAQVASQIDVLNRDFRRANADVGSTPAPFLPLATDARIEFFLATTSPTGAPTTGIERRQTSVTAFTDDDAVKFAARGGMDAWPAANYLNIWVCPLGGGLLGYAQFPGGPDATDGVVILHSAFGTTGSAAAPFNLGRTATHEIGHWLNLNHIWGDDGTGCSGSDNVDDTPNQGGANTGAPSFPHLSCDNGPNGDMFMNYMDYVDDRAMVMFSAGQVARMQACLDGVRGAIGSGAGAIRPSSSPVVAWGPNRIDTFVLDTNRALNHKWWNGSAWGPSATGYENMGGTCTCVPQVVAWGPNRLDVFVTGTDGALYHKWWNGTAWGPSVDGFERLGGVCIGQPEVLAWGPNRLDIFVIGTDSALYHKWWNGSAWGPSLTGYERMGGVCSSQPRAVAWGANRLDVFVTGTDSALYHKWWDGSAWKPSLTAYENMGGTISAFRAVEEERQAPAFEMPLHMPGAAPANGASLS